MGAVVSPEMLRQVRLLELRTRGLVNTVFSGEYHSVFKGQGMEFAEVREYQAGDEVRSIDWNVTARMRHPYVKRYIEERELTRDARRRPVRVAAVRHRIAIQE